MSFLNRIESPADLKKLTPEELPKLCEEIRQQIIPVIANVGGHLASNLGVVELTVAMHYLLNTPEDLIVWDTSNQAYTHKLLTGRREQFHTIRQFGGMSGFCKREESPMIRLMPGMLEPGCQPPLVSSKLENKRGNRIRSCVSLVMEP